MSDVYGPYRVVRVLAARNQSRIELVENTHASSRHEVLKRILIVPNNIENSELIDAEGQGAELQHKAHLRNPHIIDVYDKGRLDEYFFVSMEYVEGINLEEYMKFRAGPLTPKEAASIADELCSQVATLHQFTLTVDGKSQAFLHNDIKPSNVQISKGKNEIRLIDFGAAKSVTYSKNFTRNDFASVAYCSPERLLKGLSDTHTDLWSIAVVLYEMVAGRLPFQASTHQQLEKIISSGAPISPLAESCPAPLRAIIFRALSTRIEDRYLTAAAFGKALREFCSDSSGAENPTRRIFDSRRNPPPPAGNKDSGEAVTFTTRPHSSKIQDPAQEGSSVLNAVWGAIKKVRAIRVFQAFLVLLALYLAAAAWSARGKVHAFCAWLEKQDFSILSISDINARTLELRGLRSDNTFGSLFVFFSELRSAVKPRLMEVAERPINSYRTDQHHTVRPGDWQQARACLNFANEIDASDKLARAELDLVEGHLAIRNRKYQDARVKFNAASVLTPNSPDPWLGLAFVDAYGEHNLQALIHDQGQAEQNHYSPVQREAAQRGDVSKFLGHKALQMSVDWRRNKSKDEELRFLREADADYVQAEKEYQGCRGAFNTEQEIRDIHRQRDVIQKRLSELDEASK
jgi:serine/threonine protein kinase